MPLKKGTEQYDSAVELFGEGYIEKLITDAEQKTTELEDAGVASKEADTEAAAAPLIDAAAATPPAVEEEGEEEEGEEQAATSDPIPVEIDIEALATQIEKSFTADLAPLAEGIAELATVVSKAMKRIEALEKSDSQKSETEMPRYRFSLKRASDAEETAVKDDDSLKEKKPEETENTDGSIASRFFPAHK